MRIVNSIMVILFSLTLSSCIGLFHSAKVGDIDGIKKAIEKGEA